MDVKHIMLPGGKRHYQFTAIDVLGKRRCLRAYSSESSRKSLKISDSELDNYNVLYYTYCGGENEVV